jgi:hypothetical protein
MANVFVGTVGLRIRVTLGIDLSGAGTAKIKYKKPDDTEGEWTATVENATVGIINYVTVPGDLDVPGTWHLNGVWDPDGDDYFVGATACLSIRETGDYC